VYWLLLALVISPLGDEALAGLGIGFQVFEGLSFPCFLGVAMAGASLVGHSVGAQDPEGALEAVRSARFAGRIFGIGFAGIFLFGGGFLAGFFEADPAVYEETLRYVRILAFSQYWVAMEAANEKVLVGSGQTRAIYWMSPLGNLLRVPLGWALAIALGFGTAGVWWAINATTWLKAWLFWSKVQRGDWLDEALADARREAAED
jgi:Na+-driven multidrug efflux pump